MTRKIKKTLEELKKKKKKKQRKKLVQIKKFWPDILLGFFCFSINNQNGRLKVRAECQEGNARRDITSIRHVPPAMQIPVG